MAKGKPVDKEQAQKDAIAAQLNEKKVAFDPKASLSDLQTLLDAHTIPADRHVPKAGAVKPAEDHDSVEVGDPEELKPVTLPLVIKPKGGVKDDEFGGWANASSCAYAKTLNAYAYKNAKKWRKKKNVLIARLVELNEMHPEDAAEKLATLVGDVEDANRKLSYTDKRLASK